MNTISSPQHVLVIDDNPAVGRFFQATLRPLGIGVRVANNGVTGLQMALQQQPDLIFLDFVMPRMNGWEFCRTLDAKNLLIGVPIVILSTLLSDDATALRRHPRVTAYLPKPMDAATVAGLVQQWLPSGPESSNAELRKASQRDLSPSQQQIDRVARALHDAALHELPALAGIPDLAQITRRIADAALASAQGPSPSTDAAALAQIIEDAYRDPLTGLPNRSQLANRLSKTLAADPRPEPSILVAIELANLGLITDGLGHDAGECVLVEVAERLEHLAGEHAELARIGGERFALWLKNKHDPETVKPLVTRIKTALEQPICITPHQLFATVRIGVTTTGSLHKSGEDVIRDTEVALGEAGNASSDTFTIFTRRMQERAVSTLRLDSSLRRALHRDELVVYYQPIVTADMRAIVGVEALVRWCSPEYGFVLPEDFLPVATSGGMLGEIARQTQVMACKQVAAWNHSVRQDTPLMLSINVVESQLNDPRFIVDVQGMAETAGLAPAHLKLEILENALIADPDKVADVLGTLKALGYGIGLDDFGTGYASLTYVNRLPFDFIKIDRSFVAAMGESAKARLLVTSVAAMAQKLNLTLIGEGVETPEQYQQLASLGCDMMQGFYFYRPLPAEQLAGLL